MGSVNLRAVSFAVGPITRPARPVAYLSLVTDDAAPTQPDYGFTSHDLIALTCWMQRADGHGYRRMLIERGSGESRPDEGGYVLVYAPGREWASWGLSRIGLEIVVWQCSDGADLGRFATMLQALERLPPVWIRRVTMHSKPTRRVWR